MVGTVAADFRSVCLSFLRKPPVERVVLLRDVDDVVEWASDRSAIDGDTSLDGLFGGSKSGGGSKGGGAGAEGLLVGIALRTVCLAAGNVVSVTAGRL